MKNSEYLLTSSSHRGDLSLTEREDYINAVLCLQSLPPRFDNVTVPGARGRFDDFLAVHINLTGSIHATVSLVTENMPTQVASLSILLVSPRLTSSRPIFSHGTDISPGYTNRLYATNVATRATNR